MSNVIVQDAQKVSAFARAVVAKRIAIIAVITVVIQLALSYGWVTPDISNNVLHWVNSALDGLSAIIAIAVIHPVVTPVKDPRDATGAPLVSSAAVHAEIYKAVAASTTTSPVVVNQTINSPAETVDDFDLDNLVSVDEPAASAEQAPVA